MADHAPVDWPDACRAVLETAAPQAKAEAAASASTLIAKAARLAVRPTAAPPRPARPDRPSLVAPGQTRKRSLGAIKGRIALLHALAHIEFNAIDLAFDMALRFAHDIDVLGLDGDQFVRDWVRVGGEEAGHFLMIERRLEALGVCYGDLPAHDGLWTAAETTAHDVLARLAIAPLVLEARGLDVTPDMAARLAASDDPESAAALEKIYTDEIGHVAVGADWFGRVAGARGVAPEVAFRRLVKSHFAGSLKPPFNVAGRDKAGIPRAFYELAPQ